MSKMGSQVPQRRRTVGLYGTCDDIWVEGSREALLVGLEDFFKGSLRVPSTIETSSRGSLWTTTTTTTSTTTTTIITKLY